MEARHSAILVLMVAVTASLPETLPAFVSEKMVSYEMISVIKK